MIMMHSICLDSDDKKVREAMGQMMGLLNRCNC